MLSQSEVKETQRSSGYRQNQNNIFEFIRSQFASLLATAIDYSFFLFAFKVVHVYYVASSAIGNLAGAIFHFTASRIWVFRSRDERIHLQASKYFIISLSSAIINSLAIYTFKEFIGIREEYAKLLSAVSVGILINYPLFKFFVFKKSNEMVS